MPLIKKTTTSQYGFNVTSAGGLKAPLIVSGTQNGKVHGDLKHVSGNALRKRSHKLGAAGLQTGHVKHMVGLFDTFVPINTATNI